MENPYSPPLSAPSELPRPDLDFQRLHGIAVSQRRVMLCVLGYLGFVIFSMFFGGSQASIIAGIFFLILAVSGLFCVVQLANRLKGTAAAVVVGILSLIPFLGLIALLVVNSWASKELKKAGFRIGLLGASPGEVLQAMQASHLTAPS